MAVQCNTVPMTQPRDRPNFSVSMDAEVLGRVDDTVKTRPTNRSRFLERGAKGLLAAERAAEGNSVEVDAELIGDAVSQYLNDGQATLTGEFGSQARSEND